MSDSEHASRTAPNLKLATSLRITETPDSLAGVTVFAPNDAALKAITSVTVDLSKTDLSEVLSHHIAPDISSASCPTDKSFLTLRCLVDSVSNPNYIV